jgi:hypothetical protein
MTFWPSYGLLTFWPSYGLQTFWPSYGLQTLVRLLHFGVPIVCFLSQGLSLAWTFLMPHLIYLLVFTRGGDRDTGPMPGFTSLLVLAFLRPSGLLGLPAAF